ncbi:alpha/beta hydrolase [Planctomicrobium piriforme]|uniref:Putative esterase n=1 Tax=Planctomicrobium piriforme TaxID=1576369 RepID=A0A1I3Q346_9PLAN|nr:alpha/beta hydrolase-fold protein [Planctomicrobium piriforme]SFJ27576.1 Putative esterase [Planctomicrobium piriforme]
MLVEHAWPRPQPPSPCPIWLQLPPGGAAAVRRCWLVLDAEFYLNRMDAPAAIAEVQQQFAGDVAALFVSHFGQPERHRDYACNADFSRLLVQDLLPWLRSQCPALEEGGHTVIGLSLSGLAAAHLAMLYPKTFSSAICQSPSFWWESERFRRELPQLESPRPRFWVSVGKSELESRVSHPPSGLFQGTNQLESCRRTVQDLQRAGYAAELHEYDGGHETACWKLELPSALKWLSAES